MKKWMLSALASFFIIAGLTGCKTMGAVKEDLGSVFNKSSDAPLVAPSDRRQLVRDVQTMLSEKGYDPGPIDGQDGASTKSALRAFQGARGLPSTAGVTDEAYIQLASDKEKTESASDSRECVKNFTKQSGLRNYRTTANLDGVSQKLATERLLRALARDSFVIGETDSSRGFVSASFSSGSGHLQFSAFIEQRGRGSHAELNFANTGAGFDVLFISGSTYRSDLCEYVEIMRKGG